jgi:hypothetical protein
MQMQGADFARLLIRATKCTWLLPAPAQAEALGAAVPLALLAVAFDMLLLHLREPVAPAAAAASGTKSYAWYPVRRAARDRYR